MCNIKITRDTTGHGMFFSARLYALWPGGGRPIKWGHQDYLSEFACSRALCFRNRVRLRAGRGAVVRTLYKYNRQRCYQQRAKPLLVHVGARLRLTTERPRPTHRHRTHPCGRTTAAAAAATGYINSVPKRSLRSSPLGPASGALLLLDDDLDLDVCVGRHGRDHALLLDK